MTVRYKQNTMVTLILRKANGGLCVW